MSKVDKPARLFLSLTPHGYGHAAMTAPLVTALKRRLPELRITVQTSLPETWLRTRIEGAFDLVADTPDFGACMVDAIRVDVPATLERYRRLHAGLDAVIGREAERIRALGADLVLSNISYVALAAAAAAGVPGVGLSCFTWADILRGCAPDDAEAARLAGEMDACYSRAAVMLQAEPALPMTGLANVRRIGPMARPTAARRAELAGRLGLGQGDRVGLIGFGGIDLSLPLAGWARLEGWHWLTPEPAAGRPDMTLWSDTGLSFSQLLASADVVITKPGYGTFTECAVNGTPVLYLPRPGWPETPYLTDWLGANARALEVSAGDLLSDRLAEQLRKLFSLPVKPLPIPSGAAEAAGAILAAASGQVFQRLP